MVLRAFAGVKPSRERKKSSPLERHVGASLPRHCARRAGRSPLVLDDHGADASKHA
jgi:hypothetical protein